jgi:hypothetical protein
MNEASPMQAGNRIQHRTRAKFLLVVVFFMGAFAAFVEYSATEIGADSFQLAGNALQRQIGLIVAHIIVLTALMIGVWRRQHWAKVVLLSYFFVTSIVSGVGIFGTWYLTSNFPIGFFVACATQFAAWLLLLHSANIKRLANPGYVSIFTG